MNKFNIIVDSREKRPLEFPKEEDSCYNIIICQKLDTGDYSIQGLEDKVAFERKGSVSELAQNIVEPRFNNVIKRLSDFKYKFLILEFGLDDIKQYPVGSTIPKDMWDKIRMNSGFILSFLTQLQIFNNIHVVFSGDRDNAAMIVLKLMKRIYVNEFGS